MNRILTYGVGGTAFLGLIMLCGCQKEKVSGFGMHSRAALAEQVSDYKQRRSLEMPALKAAWARYKEDEAQSLPNLKEQYGDYKQRRAEDRLAFQDAWLRYLESQ